MAGFTELMEYFPINEVRNLLYFFRCVGVEVWYVVEYKKMCVKAFSIKKCKIFVDMLDFPTFPSTLAGSSAGR